MMLNRLILKVTKFQLPPPKRLGTVVKNILGGGQIGLKKDSFAIFVFMFKNFCFKHKFKQPRETTIYIYLPYVS